MKIGQIYFFSPLHTESNPDRFSSSRIGLLLEVMNGDIINTWKILSSNGVEFLLTSRWVADPVPQFVGDKHETVA